MKSDFWKASALLLVIVVVAGCAAGRAFSRAERAARAGDWDAAVAYYSQAVQADPNSAEYRIALERAQLAASRIHLDRARGLEEKGDLEGAIAEYKRASDLDPSNRNAMAKATELERTIRERVEASRPKPQFEQLKEKARQSAEPYLNPASRQPLVFKFAAGIQVRQILDFLAQASGINVMYDSTYVDTTTTKSAIDLDGVTLEQALTLVLTSNGLFYKVLNPKTIVVAPDNNAMRTKYEDQVIRTFYLSHSDATEMLTLLNGILGGAAIGGASQRPLIQPNKGANSITIRGSASIVGIAERVIENNDKPKAEVVIDVEILEVNRTKVKQYGLNLSNYQIGLQFSPEQPPSGSSSTGTGGGAAAATTNTGQFNLNSIVHGINTADFYLSVPAAVVKFLESDSRTKLIAKPSLRGQEGTKLTANLGDEIPVPSTTFQPLISGGTAINPMTSFSYRPVGVNVAVTPRVTYDGDVILELEVESSTKGSDVNVAGQNLPSFGTRKVNTKMRLRDGESNLLAGLLRDDERKSLAGVPGSIHVPIIKELFAANDSQISQTDIVMLLTPHIIRSQGVTERNLQQIYIGTASNPVIGGTPPLIAAPADEAAQGQMPSTQPTSAQPGPPVSTQPYGTPGAALVGGAPVGRTTPQGTPVVPPGSSPIPGTVMQPPPTAPTPQQQPATAMVPTVPTPVAPTPVAPTPTAPPTPVAPTPGAAPAARQGGAGQAAQASPATSAQTTGPAQVTVSTPGPEWRVGQGPYTVTLSAMNITRVTTISLTLTYNPAALKLRSLQEGSFMRAGVSNTAFAHQEDNATGRIDLTISRTGDVVGATGAGTLAAVVFDAVAPGTVSFRINGVAGGPGGNIPLQFTPATVTVK